MQQQVDKRISRPLLVALVIASATGVSGTEQCTECDNQSAAALTRTAVAYRSEGRLELAERFHQRALIVAEAIHGKSHPEVAACLNNLAELYREQGRAGKAEPLYRRAAHILREALGPEDPAVATVLHNLGDLYAVAGRFDDAEQAYLSAVAIKERHLGAGLRLAATLNNLGELRRRQGEFEAARTLFQRALTIWRRELGEDHAYTRLARHNLALTGATVTERTVNERWSTTPRNAPGPWAGATRTPAPNENPTP